MYIFQNTSQRADPAARLSRINVQLQHWRTCFCTFVAIGAVGNCFDARQMIVSLGPHGRVCVCVCVKET